MNKKIISSYSKSLFQNIHSKNQKTEKKSFTISEILSGEDKTGFPDIYIIGEELSLLRAIIISSPEIKKLFENPTYSEGKKLEILFEIFPGLSFTMKSFLKILMEKNHLFYIPEICNDYQQILLKFQNFVKVKLITSSPLDENFGNSFFKNLKELTKAKEVLLSIAYNPKLLGGFIIEYNSQAIDLSILQEFSLVFDEI